MMDQQYYQVPTGRFHEHKCLQCNGTGSYRVPKWRERHDAREGYSYTFSDTFCAPCKGHGIIRYYGIHRID